MLYGGQGNDSLVALGAGGDTMSGGLGDNLFVENGLLLPDEFAVNDMSTVEDFVSGNDSLSRSAFSNDVGLAKENDLFANNASDALSFANNYYANHSSSLQHLFIYGGSGAGCLFYNGVGIPEDFPENGATEGMILVGDNAESSLSANDFVRSNLAG